MSENVLKNLIGCEMSSVEFVRDYCQLRFDGPTLTAFVMPVLTIGNEQLNQATPGYRDALCSLIGQEVCKTEVAPKDKIRLYFVSGTVLSVPINDEEYVECAMFDDQSGSLKFGVLGTNWDSVLLDKRAAYCKKTRILKD